MAYSPTPYVTQFAAALPTISPRSFAAGGIVYRAVLLRYLFFPNPTALYTQGPMNKPLRYSPPSQNGYMTPSGWHQAVNVPLGLNPLPSGDYTFPGLYVAEHPETAYLEANQQAIQRLRAGIPMPHLPALSMLGLELQASALDLLDLTHPPDLNTIGITRRQIVRPWSPINTAGPGLTGEWAPTQILGYLAYQDPRFQGIRYPSAQNRGKPCVFIFTDKLIPGTHRLTVGDDTTGVPARLPKECCGLALEAVP